MNGFIVTIATICSITVCWAQSSNDLYRSGNKKLSEGDNYGAILEYSKAIESNPSDPDYYYGRGISKVNLKDYREAILDFELAIKLDSTHDDAYMGRGVCMKALEQFDQAILDFNKAIQINPQSKGAFFNLGLTFLDKRECQSAIFCFSQAIELEQDFNNYNNYFNRGRAKECLKDYRGAILDYNEVIAREPDFAYAYEQRGKSKIIIGQISKGCLDFSKAGELGWPVYDLISKYCN